MVWKRYSLPMRRAVSPLQGSSTPRMAKSTLACLQDLRQRLGGALVRGRRTSRRSRRSRGTRRRACRPSSGCRGPSAQSPRGRGVDAPRVALRLHRLEGARQLGREARLLLHQVAAHVDDLVDVLDQHRARLFAGAAGRAGPEHVVVDQALADDVLADGRGGLARRRCAACGRQDLRPRARRDSRAGSAAAGAAPAPCR